MKKKILIIGSNSFISLNFIEQNFHKYEFFTISKTKNKITNLSINLTKNNNNHLKKILKNKKFDVVIDLVWMGVLGKYRNNKIQKLNLSITKNIKFLLNLINFDKFISFGSQAEYGVQNKKLKESDSLKPTTLYAKIKCKKFNILKNFIKKKRKKFIWFRLFSCYGKYCDKNWLIMYLIYCIKKKISPKLTEGSQIRSFLHVDDICSAINIAVQNKKIDGVFNLAHSKLYSIKEVYSEISKKFKLKKKNIFNIKRKRNDQPTYLNANIEKLKKYNWEPRVDLKKGILKTIKQIKV